MPYSRQSLAKRDAKDPLGAFRDEFILPRGVIYLDGNSLGAMPKAAMARSQELVSQEWGQDLITSWNRHGWFDLPTRLGDKLADLIGAKNGEVLITDSTGINLYKLLSMALDLRPGRKVILMEGSNFPTDNYMAQGLARQLDRGHEIRFAERENMAVQITPEVAVVALTQVHYKTGAMFDMEAITQMAHKAGALICWDLCHSAGALPVDLAGANADFAVGCSYKFLNGGPGAPAFLYVAKRHQGKATQPLSGWWSHADPFAFERDYRPAGDIHQMLSGTQPILSLTVMECGLDMMLRADMDAIRQKSMALGDVFIGLMAAHCAGSGFALASHPSAQERGSQVSFTHPHGYAIMQALIDQGVIGDFRAPDILRFGLTPLYTRYVDIWGAVEAIKTVMDQNLWQDPRYARRARVT
ncbi:MAG: kynureninase [Robiginitomaculum sp.]|nr:kynureninase [Robiginitomaculum sp.]MDQ7077816.1 kynureninase [Robiginitomaculum sp.]